jgi:phosphomannomutase/phosphoglucomutase
MDSKLRQDPRVSLWENTDARQLDSLRFEPAPDFIVVDVAFISLRLIVPDLLRLFGSASFVFLFKPQFEVGRFAPRKKGGVVYDEDAQRSLEEFLLFLKQLGLTVGRVEKSRVKGAKGNQEFFVMAKSTSSVKAVGPVSSSSTLQIFRTYDIRGVADRDLSTDLFEKLGFVLGRRVLLEKGPGLVGVGRDARVSSPRLFEALTRGLARHPQLHLLDLGLTSSPLVYFAAYHFGLHGAFQITASHNPGSDNGLKMMIGENSLLGDQIRELGQEVLSIETLPELSEGPLLKDRSADLRDHYLDFFHQQFKPRIQKKFKVVIDTGNGMGGVMARRVFAPFCEQLEILFEDLDGRFPNHPADPTVASTLKALQERVRLTQADIGFAYDGDADRIGVVTAQGQILFGDEILMLLSEQVLKERPGSLVIGEVKCSQKLFQAIRNWGGEPMMYRTGHSLIKAEMKRTGAPIAGEMSGHVFFSDRFFGFDDALYASLRVLEVLSRKDQTLDQWMSQFPTSFITPEWRIERPLDEVASAVDRIQRACRGLKDVELNSLDGIRGSFSDGSWFLVRTSNTQPVIVVRVEALQMKRLQEHIAWLESVLGFQLPDWAPLAS